MSAAIQYLGNGCSFGENAVTRLVSFWAACALVVVGGIKMVLQATYQETLLIPTCLGQTLTVQIGGNAWSALHCWGCYSVLLGLVIFGALTAYNIQTSRS